MSKKELAVEMIKAFPMIMSAFTSRWTACTLTRSHKYLLHVIDTIKINRLVCPSGVMIKLNDSTSSTLESDLRSVRVEGLAHTGFMLMRDRSAKTRMSSYCCLGKTILHRIEQTVSLSPGPIVGSLFHSAVISHAFEH